jgi:hypothetical protein
MEVLMDLVKASCTPIPIKPEPRGKKLLDA